MLGEDTPERVGWSRAESMAWWATGFPLLAWEYGVGWMREPPAGLFGEVAGSEAFRLESTEVDAADGLEVMGTGELQGIARTGDTGRTVHAFSAESVRDVAVVVGDYLGPYPYTDLWVTVVPDFPSGVEFPSAIFYGDVDPAAFVELVPHETAHMWLYGLVGNDQGRDPFLDEGLASFVEAQVLGYAEVVALLPVPEEVDGYLGGSMAFWEERDPELYGAGVYGGGAAAFARARQAAGGEAFDAALRGYVSEEAHRIATPADLAEAFAGVPAALAVLTAAGAFAGDQGDP